MHPSGEFLAHSGRLAREQRRADSPWSTGKDDLADPYRWSSMIATAVVPVLVSPDP
jgi:hypothetical protein